MYIPPQNAPKSHTTKTQSKNNRRMQLEPPCPASTFVMMCFNHKLNQRCTKPNESDRRDDFRRQVIYTADTPKHGHTQRCVFPRTPLGLTIQPNTQTPRRDQRHAADIKLLMLLSHFVTSLATAVFSSLQRTTGVICVEKCVASAKPTVVT